MAENGPAENLASSGCWTCKDRRVRCDRKLPTCLNCARVRSKCQGYGTRLFWPKGNDSKRAVVGKSSPRRKRWSRSAKLHIIHTSFRDIEMHNYLLDPSTRRIPFPARTLPRQLVTPASSPWKPTPLDGKETELVQCFTSTAFSSLVVFNQDASGFRDLLIQMALSDDTAPSRAVLFALLAFSSQYRDGLQSRAVQFKTSAISALARSAENGPLSTTEAAQHVAAGMLLCSFEIQTSSESSGQWLWYVRGVQDIIKATHLDKQANTAFVADLLDWFYYHGVIAQFSILHWRRDSEQVICARELGSKGWEWISGAKGPLQTAYVRHPHRILRFLSEIFNVLFQALEQRNTIENCIASLNALEGQANTVAELSARYSGSSTEASTNATDMIRLYQMAAIIYLSRVSESISGELRDIQSILENAFALLCGMSSCELQFPLLILGCEARTDEQRLMILDLVHRTEKNTYGRSIDCLRGSLKALWIQEDLVSDQEFVPKYMERLSAIISKTRFIPSLV